jgi:hypothetical protein
MTLLGVRCESSHLADRVGNIGSSVCGEVEKHTDNSSCSPTLVPHQGPSQGQIEQQELGSCCCNHSNLLNEARLGQGKCTGGIVPCQLDTEVFEQALFLGEFEPSHEAQLRNRPQCTSLLTPTGTLPPVLAAVLGGRGRTVANLAPPGKDLVGTAVPCTLAYWQQKQCFGAGDASMINW